MRRIVRLVCVLLTSCAGPSRPLLELHPCHLEGLAEEVHCGSHEVFEDRAANAGRRLSIRVAVLPALRRVVDPDPLFIFAGGPGQGARGLADAAARFFKRVRRSRDIVLVDLRGTGGSDPLRCPEGGDELEGLTLEAMGAQIRTCLAAIDADVRHYTPEQSLRDVDEIRRALGYDRVNLWGGSWGTRAALLYALRFPDATRTVVLDGAVPLALEFPRTASADAGAALDRLIADCQADAGCARAFPDPHALVAAFDRRFERGPVTARIRHPRTAIETTVVIPRSVAADMIRGALYVPRDATSLLRVVDHAVQLPTRPDHGYRQGPGAGRAFRRHSDRGDARRRRGRGRHHRDVARTRIDPAETRRLSDARFDRLLQEHDAVVRRLAHSYERDPARRQDLVQEVRLPCRRPNASRGDGSRS